ncbi:hypothetical protein HW571_24650 [Agrobacterium genomosp. 3]|uniref:hypothetical protein n=1 Tax=Agrobacterium tomkonis TaxID=1183410 RepID=UPI001F89C0F3|nr:hypothetical protein [Agrobacterium tomkonis]MCA1879253.1 hypothetical protein [Agrobacterium tumefaciens]MCA1894416.1 hypothetical protein [Agrobacterium tomkonis]
MILLPNSNGTQAADIADALRRQIEQIEVLASEGRFSFTASFGVATRLPRHKSP